MEVLLIPLAIVLGTAAVVSVRSKQKHRRAIWTQVASERGGKHIVPRGLFNRERERIEVVDRQIPMTMETYTTGSGNTTTVWTACSAGFLYGYGPRLRVYREGLFQALGKALGTQDVALGIHGVFDDTFMVKCDEGAVVRRMWSPETMETMLAQFSRARLEVEDNVVKLVEVGVYNDSHKMRAAFDLLRELAAQDLFGTDALRRIPGATFVASGQGSPRAELQLASAVVIEAVDSDGTLVTIARLSGAPQTSPMTLDVVDGGVEAREQMSKLPQAAHVHVQKVGTGRLSVEAETATFTWREIQTDPGQMRAAAELLATLTTRQAGVFR